MADADASPEEVELLAELEAGLLDGAGREHAEALAATERGREVLAALGRVRADLAALPAPALPAGFPDRLRAVLDEHALPLTTAGRPVRRAGLSRSAPWLVGAAAASLALAASVGTGVLRPGPPESQAVRGGAGAEDTDGSGAESTGAERAGPPAGPAGAPEAGPASGPSGGPLALPEGAPVPAVASGRDYGREDLPRAASDLPVAVVSDRSAPDSGSGGGGRVDGAAGSAPPSGAPVELTGLADPVALRSCLLGLGPGLAEPLVVDFARFEGTAALVVLVEDTAAGTATTYVVGPSCSAADPDLRHAATP